MVSKSPVLNVDQSLGPLETLFKTCRVLPLGAPGYRPWTQKKLQAWGVKWIRRQFELLPAVNVEFNGCENGENFNSVLVRSKEITKGFSGGPLWDTERQMVVGMVRRFIPEMPDKLRSTDARFIINYASIDRGLDSRLRELYQQIRLSCMDSGRSNRF